MMFYYKDKTFCPWWLSCEDGETCDRAMSDEVLEGAMNSGTPLAQYVNPPINCYKKKPNANNSDA